MEAVLTPNAHAIGAMLLTAVAVILFMRERIPLETSSLVILVFLLIGFQAFPYQYGRAQLRGTDFLQNFGHPALIAVCALIVAGQGLIRTGALEPIGRVLARLWAASPRASMLLTLIVAFVISGFINHTPVIILLLPLLVGVMRRAKSSAGSVLMPIGFAALMGGMGTSIGTSTNLLVVSISAQMGVRHFGMFDFTLPVVIVGGVGLLYLWLIAPRLLPDHAPAATETSPRAYAADLTVQAGGFAQGRPLAQAIEKTQGEMNVTGVLRRSDALLAPLPDMVLHEGDNLRVKATPAQLKEFEQLLGARLDISATGAEEKVEGKTEDLQIAEAVITQGSTLEGGSLNRAGFFERYRLAPLAIHHRGRPLEKTRQELADVALHPGDIILLEGAREEIARMRRGGEMLVLDPTVDLPLTNKAPLALVIMAAIVIAAATGLLPIAISAVTGVLLMILTGCLTWRAAATAIPVAIVLLIGVSISLGVALQETGAAKFLASVFVHLAAGASPALIVSGLMLLMAVLTNVMANSATGILGTPIAIGIAHQLGQPPEPFVLAVLFGANMGFIFPTETNLLILNAGRYGFADFVKVGTLLTLIMWAGFSLLLPRLYGL